MKLNIKGLTLLSLLLCTVLVGVTFLINPPQDEATQQLSALRELAEQKEESASEVPDTFATIIDQEELLLRPEDIKDVAGLLTKLTASNNAIAIYLRQQLPPTTQAMLQALQPSAPDAAKHLAKALNLLIQNTNWYDAKAFSECKFSYEVRKLAEQTSKGLQGEELMRLNRQLLAELFPQEIKKVYQTPQQPRKKPGQGQFQIFAGLLALLGAPLFAVIGAISLFLTTHLPSLFVNILDKLVASSSLFVTLPLFTFAGFLLSESKAPQRLVAFSQALLGWLPGGTALIAVVTCAFFTAFTGASGVTIIAVGGLLYPLLTSSKYSENFSLGLLTSSGSLGLLFPPSLPLILYAVIAHNCLQGIAGQEVPIRDLFLAGLLPGILLTLSLGLYGAFAGSGSKDKLTTFSASAMRSATVSAIPELLIPLVLGVGFFGGFFDLEESAAITAAYILVIEMFFYREISCAALVNIIRKSMILFGAILIILMMAIGMTSEIIDAKVPDYLLSQVQQHIQSKTTFLIVLNLFLLIVGGMMDIFSAILVVVPLIVPIAVQYDVNPLHLGIIFLTNLEIGYSTPPVGMNLFIASLRFKQSIWKLCWSVLPYLGIRLGFLVLITFIEDISLFLVRRPTGMVWLLLLFPLFILLAIFGERVQDGRAKKKHAD